MFAGVVVRLIETCPISNKQYRSLDFALRKYSIQSLQKLCKIVCRCSILVLYKNVLQNVDINFLLIISNRIIFYISPNSAAGEVNMNISSHLVKI